MSNRMVTACLSLLVLVVAGTPRDGSAYDTLPAPFTNEAGEQLHDYLTRAQAFGFSGAALAIQDGVVILNAGYGLARRAPRRSYRYDTAFDVASVAKQFTAAAVLLLEERGLLSVGDPISGHLENVPAEMASVTLHQLLTHTSGMRRDFGNRSQVVSREERVAALLATELRSAPGEAHAYSNVGYALLAAVIESVSGEPFADFMRENLFEPAGMTRTGFYGETQVWGAENSACGYYETWEEGCLVDLPFTWNALGNGHVVSTTGDLARWDAALFADGLILSPESLAKLTTPHAADAKGDFAYGYGWYVGKTGRGTRLVFHDGDYMNYSTVYRRYEDEGVTLIVTTNEGYISSLGQARTIAQSLERILFGEEESLPPVTVKLSTDAMVRFMGEYELEPGGARVAIRERNGSLVTRLRGQAAFDLFFFNGPVSDADPQAFLIRTEAFLEAKRTQSVPLLAPVVGEDRVQEFAWAIEGGWSDLESQFGPLESHVIYGHGPWPFTKRWTRTNVELRFEQERVLVTIGYRGDELFDVSTWEETPDPSVIPIAPVSEEEMASWNLWFKEGVRLRRTDEGLEIVAGDTQRVATRVR